MTMDGIEAVDPWWRRAVVVVATAATLGLVVGLVEAGYHLIRHQLGYFIWSSRHVFWMAPVSWTGFFVAAAIPLAMLALAAPRLPLAAITAGLGGAVGAFGLQRLALGQKIHPVALAIIALAVGFQLGRFVTRSPGRWARTVVRLGPLLGVLVVAGAAVMLLGDVRRRRAALATDGPGARPGAPSVLLLVLDTVRGEQFSSSGYDRPTTPKLDRFAEGGVSFDWAFSTAPWTLPSHASMFTGRWPWQLSGAFLRPLDGQYPTLAERFGREGYRTAGFSANHAYATWESGVARGFAHYEDYLVSLRQIGLSSELGQLLSSRRSSIAMRAAHRTYADEVNRQVLAWLPADFDQRPFFMFVNYMDAHLPYRTPAAWEARFKGRSPKVDGYDAALAYLDDRVGRLLDSLEARGALRNTIVVITADHGEHLDDHGMDDHANSLYSQLLRVPLIVRGPGIPGGQRVASAVSLIDLAPTLTGLAGVPSDSGFNGRSLARFWQGGAVTPDSIFYAQLDKSPRQNDWFRNHYGPLWSAIDQRYHLIVNPDSTRELFHYRDDPGEERNLATDPAAANVLTRLDGHVAAIRQSDRRR